MRYFIKNSDGIRKEIQENEVSRAYLNIQMREMEAVQKEEEVKKLTSSEKKEIKKAAREKEGLIFDEKTLPIKDRLELNLVGPEEMAIIESLSDEDKEKLGLEKVTK